MSCGRVPNSKTKVIFPLDFPVEHAKQHEIGDVFEVDYGFSGELNDSEPSWNIFCHPCN
jgi:hypothetical protein